MALSYVQASIALEVPVVDPWGKTQGVGLGISLVVSD
jgi:hypothetical protein